MKDDMITFIRRAKAVVPIFTDFTDLVRRNCKD